MTTKHKRRQSDHGISRAVVAWIVAAICVAIAFYFIGEARAATKSQQSVSQTRPANTTAYTAGDVVCNSASACTLLQFSEILDLRGGSGYILGIRYSCDQKSITPRTRFYIYNASNPTVSVDNAAHRDLFADAAKRLGYIDLPAMTTGEDATNSDMSYTQDFGLRHPVKAAAGSRDLFVLRKTLDAYTPASGSVCTTTLFIESDTQ